MWLAGARSRSQDHPRTPLLSHFKLLCTSPLYGGSSEDATSAFSRAKSAEMQASSRYADLVQPGLEVYSAS